MGSSPHGNSRVLVDDEYVWEVSKEAKQHESPFETLT